MFPFPSLMLAGPVDQPGYSRKWRLYIKATNPVFWATLAELQMRSTPGGANECSGGTASASGTGGGNGPANAFDGNTATRWQSGSGTMPQWIEYDFATEKKIEEVVLRASSTEETDAPTNAEVQYWDGSAWVKHFEFFTNSDWAAGESRTFTNGSTNTGVSRWRLNVTATQSAAAWTSMAEVQMRTSIGGSNAATGGAAQASAAASRSTFAAKAFDGNSGTQWQSGTTSRPQQLTYYFSTSVTIVEVAITAASATDAPTAFDLQYWDGATWQTAFSRTSPATWTNGETRVFH
jgi:hypothetical protein